MRRISFCLRVWRLFFSVVRLGRLLDRCIGLMEKEMHGFDGKNRKKAVQALLRGRANEGGLFYIPHSSPVSPMHSR